MLICNEFATFYPHSFQNSWVSSVNLQAPDVEETTLGALAATSNCYLITQLSAFYMSRRKIEVREAELRKRPSGRPKGSKKMVLQGSAVADKGPNGCRELKRRQRTTWFDIPGLVPVIMEEVKARRNYGDAVDALKRRNPAMFNSDINGVLRRTTVAGWYVRGSYTELKPRYKQTQLRAIARIAGPTQTQLRAIAYIWALVPCSSHVSFFLSILSDEYGNKLFHMQFGTIVYMVIKDKALISAFLL